MAKDGKKSSSEEEGGPPTQSTLKKALAQMQMKKKLREESELKKTEEKDKESVADELSSDPHTSKKDIVNNTAVMLKEAFPEIGISVEYIPALSVNELSKYAIRFDLTSNNIQNTERSQYASILSAQFKELFNSVTPIYRGQENKSLSVQFDYERDEGTLVLKESSKKGADNILAKTAKGFREELIKL